MAATNGIPESVAMALRYSPATAQQVRRSQYLEDALQEMAANGGKNISSGWDLAARLAAVALYKRGSNRAYDATVSALKDDQARRIAKAMAGLPSDAAPQTPPALTPPAAAEPPTTPVVPPQPKVEQAPLPPAQMSPANFRMPVDGGRMTSAYGAPRPNGPHNGVDLAVPSGTPVTAPADGEVIAVGSDPASGNFVRLRHADGSVTSYGHLSGAQVKVGDKVPVGATFAMSGATGRATGPHVHYVYRGPNGQTMDPMKLSGMQAPQVAPPQAPVPPPMPPDPNGPPDQPAMPYQIAAQGQMPPPPMPSAAGSSPPVTGATPPVSPQAAGGVNPWAARAALIKQLLQSPDYQDQELGMAEAQKLRMEMTKPPEYAVSTQGAYSIAVDKNNPANRQVTAIPELRSRILQPEELARRGIQKPPGTVAIEDSSGNVTFKEPTEGQMVVSRPGEPYRESYIPGSKGDPTRPQPPASGYQYVTPNQQAAIPGSQADQKNPANVMDAANRYGSMTKTIVDAAMKVRQNYGAVQVGFRQQNGSGDLAMINGLQKLIDEGVVRGEDVNLQLKAAGLEGGIGGVMQYLQSRGVLTPQIRRTVYQTADQLYKNLDTTYRTRVLSMKPGFEEVYGPGSFDKFVFPQAMADEMGWGAPRPAAAPAAGGGVPAVNPAQLTPGTPDAALAEAIKRKLPLSAPQQKRARELGWIR